MHDTIQDKPDDAWIKEILFEKITHEFGERGEYSVMMLKTAEHLLRQEERAPLQALAAAHCISQAMVEIFRNKENSGGSWHVLTKKIINSKRRFRNAKNPATGKLQDMFNAIDDLEKAHDDDTAHQKRIQSVIWFRMGDKPLAGRNSIAEAYQNVISEANILKHRVDSEAHSKIDAVRENYQKAVDTLVTILLPVERLGEITHLAELREPQASDATRLAEIVVSHNDFDYFASKMISPNWFRMIDRDMLEPTSIDSPWIVRSIINHLRNEHLEEFLALVNEKFDDWSKSDVGLRGLGYVGSRLGTNGLPLLIKALRKNFKSGPLCAYATRAYSNTDPSDPHVAKLADLLLKPDSGLWHHDRG